jgi:hypothetical protein
MKVLAVSSTVQGRYTSANPTMDDGLTKCPINCCPNGIVDSIIGRLKQTSEGANFPVEVYDFEIPNDLQAGD